MKVEHETKVPRSPPAGGVARPATTPVGDGAVAKTVAEIVKHLRDDSTRFAAVAPGRLDVMGGIAEYTGALVLNRTLGDHVCVAVQRRPDDKVSVTTAPEGNGAAATEIPLSRLCESNGRMVHAEQSRGSGGSARHDVATCAFGGLTEGVRAGLLPLLSGGLSICVGSTLPDASGSGRNAAVTAATVVACAAALDRALEPLAVAAVCQRVENEWLGAPVGMADAVCALLGEPNTLVQVRCEPCALAGSIRLPDDLLLLGVDCGVTLADALEKYGQVRTAAFMGRALIDRIIHHEGAKQGSWDGCLSRLSVTDYVERFRDRIPTKMKGKDFLDRFGETGDPLTRIDASGVYKIRSRTEHHVYEHARSRQFVECLSRAIRSADRHALVEAGELMYASHWSYGQRCGLGSIETDLLVNLIRRHGADADIYGAKISGRGCGGVVAVLMKSTDQALAALDAALGEYVSRTGHRANVLRGSAPGALVSGAQRL
jgi:L-arabinokinase